MDVLGQGQSFYFGSLETGAFVLKLWYNSISNPSPGMRDLSKVEMQKSEKVETKHL
jgi:hypothetical protein